MAAAGAFAVAAAAWVVGTAPPVSAHGDDPTVRTVLDRVEPAVPRVTVQVAQSVATQLVVANPTSTPLTVLDETGDPFLLIGPDGVLGNLASPSWYLSNSPTGAVTVPPDAGGGAPPRWARVAKEPSWGWFDSRLHPPPDAATRATRRRARSTLATWAIQLDYGGQPVTARGRVIAEPVRGAVTARLRGPVRPFPHVGVQLAPGRVPALFLVNRGAEPVVVTGRAGEPFLRLGPNGAEVNRRSPTWADDARAQGQDLTAAAAVVDPGAPPEWALVAASPSYSWLEFRGLYERDRPPQRVVGAGDTAVLHTWTVPLERGGRRVELQGETVWKPVNRPGD
ncbi:MAG TPA: hypothetical protein VKH17_00770 [Acidimicrobiia bacterium]|nr:hypothetical protein [Acidimicrobiia bacterium]